MGEGNSKALNRFSPSLCENVLRKGRQTCFEIVLRNALIISFQNVHFKQYRLIMEDIPKTQYKVCWILIKHTETPLWGGGGRKCCCLLNPH